MSEEDQESNNNNNIPVTGLADWWYPVCFNKELGWESPYPIELFGEPLVLYRGPDGKPVCLQDKCPHRSVPLSIGRITSIRQLQCRYHGWTFNEKGNCVNIPSFASDKPVPPRVCVVTYPTHVIEGMVFVWPGDPEKCSLDPKYFPPTPPEVERETGEAKNGWNAYDQNVDQDYAWYPLVENLLDPAHLQFTHEGTQGKYIAPVEQSVPEATNYEVYDIENIPGAFAAKIRTDKTTKPQDNIITFFPPYTVRIEIKFGNGWRFHQMHYCVPVSKTRTRLLLRSMRDWLKWVPESFIWRMNPLVLRQDAAILVTQGIRLAQGASRWNYPVSADSLGIRFRQWYEKNQNVKQVWFKGYSGSSFKKGGGVVRGNVEDIEDVPKCYGNPDMLLGTESVSLKTTRQIVTESKALWKDQDSS
jgi:phenylpropionate dioxygenase-like ring-hydroxylating dioxygenase large terminal subunit